MHIEKQVFQYMDTRTRTEESKTEFSKKQYVPAHVGGSRGEFKLIYALLNKMWCNYICLSVFYPYEYGEK
mgnify:CR=1 FL=1